MAVPVTPFPQLVIVRIFSGDIILLLHAEVKFQLCDGCRRALAARTIVQVGRCEMTYDI
jgi:hypothetical protein